MSVLKLYLVHCGYYDPGICDGLFESHANLFVVAADFESARAEAKKNVLFQQCRMHVDGVQEVAAVQGFEVLLREVSTLDGRSVITSHKHRDLAPKSTTTF